MVLHSINDCAFKLFIIYSITTLIHISFGLFIMLWMDCLSLYLHKVYSIKLEADGILVQFPCLFSLKCTCKMQIFCFFRQISMWYDFCSFSDELLLQDDGDSNVSSILTDFSNMHVGSSNPSTGIGRFSMPSASLNLTSQRQISRSCLLVKTFLIFDLVLCSNQTLYGVVGFIRHFIYFAKTSRFKLVTSASAVVLRVPTTMGGFQFIVSLPLVGDVWLLWVSHGCYALNSCVFYSPLQAIRVGHTPIFSSPLELYVL